MYQKPLRIFFIIWLGQFVSIIGTAMTRFALIIWAYQQTGSATTLALMGFFSFGATVLASPIAGGWIDQLDRRKVMIGADAGAGLVTLILFILTSSDSLLIWHLYAAQIIIGALDAFQKPAYTTAITVLIPKQHYTRVNGLRSLAMSFSEVLAPMIAGALLVVINIQGIMLVDLLTFLIAMGTLLFIRLPNPPIAAGDQQTGLNFWQKFLFGIKYILGQPGLSSLLVVMTMINLFAALTWYAVMPAMVLARSGGDELALATVQTAMGIGGIIGGLLMSLWGGPKRRIHSVLGASVISFLLGDLLFGIGRGVPVWSAGAILGSIFIPFIVGGNVAIWQEKVPLAIQGRIFVVQGALRMMTLPIGYLLGGLLADYLFEPSMNADGVFVDYFSWLVGSGNGAGMGLMFVFTGLLGSLTAAVGYLYPALRNVEDGVDDDIALPVAVSAS